MANRISKQIDWEKLATRAGFKDGAKARAHYEILLKPRETALVPPKKRQRVDADDTGDADGAGNCYKHAEAPSTPARSNISTWAADKYVLEDGEA